MPTLTELVSHLDMALDARALKDYCPNGLQVEGRAAVSRVVTGVSASLELIERAAEQRADALVVHHGLIWGGGIERVIGPTAKRLRALISYEMSLIAYHLPLDRHSTLGNNAGIADLLGLSQRRPFGEVRGAAIGIVGELSAQVSPEVIFAQISRDISRGRTPFVFPHGPRQIRTVAVCSGAASDLIEAAHAAGADLYLTGELAERAGDLARELGIHLVAAGHVATEVFGPQRLAVEIANQFQISAEFIEISSPL